MCSRSDCVVTVFWVYIIAIPASILQIHHPVDDVTFPFPIRNKNTS